MIQEFLGVPKDLFEAEAALAPRRCDQKRTELLLHKLLNQVDSPAARVKVTFINFILSRHLFTLLLHPTKSRNDVVQLCLG